MRLHPLLALLNESMDNMGIAIAYDELWFFTPSIAYKAMVGYQIESLNRFSKSRMTVLNAGTVTQTVSTLQSLLGTPSYLWDFGDGQTSTLQNPSHVYVVSGNYNVTLQVAFNGYALDVVSPLTAIAPQGAGNAAGAAIASAFGKAAIRSVGTAAGVAISNASGKAAIRSAGHATGIASGSFSGSFVSGSYGASFAAAFASAIGKSLARSAGSSSGTASTSVIGRALFKSTGSAAGSSTASGIGDGTSGNASTGSAIGLAVVSATGKSLKRTAGSAAGAATASGVGRSSARSTGTAAGTATAAGTTVNILLNQTNFTYVGAYRVPNSSSNGQGLSYGGVGIAHNSVNNTLFIVSGIDKYVGAITIPALVNSNNIASLNTCTFSQAFRSILGTLPSNPDGAGEVGGLLVYNGKLIGTAYVYYDGGGTATLSHFVLSSLTLSSATLTGLYRVGTMGGGWVGGFMTSIPAALQTSMGYPAITGQGDIPIISRTSSGPAAFGFDPDVLGPTTAPVSPYVYYDLAHTLGPYEHADDPLQNSVTHIGGMVFVPGTSSVLYFGSTGLGYIGYGLGSNWNDASDASKGPHPLNGKRAFQIWAYRVDDFIAVKAGARQPWQAVPYNVWNFTLPIAGSGPYWIVGATLDASINRVYLSVAGVDTVAAFSSLPLIYAFDISTTAAAPGQLPQIGTLNGYPTTTASGTDFDTPQYWGTYPGSVHIGDPVVLTAGNVYDINPGGSITGVAFYRSPVGGNSFGSSTLMGAGAQSSIPYADHNWVYTMSTTGLAAGTYTIFAQATNSNSAVSAPIPFSLTLVV